MSRTTWVSCKLCIQEVVIRFKRGGKLNSRLFILKSFFVTVTFPCGWIDTLTNRKDRSTVLKISTKIRSVLTWTWSYTFYPRLIIIKSILAKGCSNRIRSSLDRTYCFPTIIIMLCLTFAFWTHFNTKNFGWQITGLFPVWHVVDTTPLYLDYLVTVKMIRVRLRLHVGFGLCNRQALFTKCKVPKKSELTFKYVNRRIY